MQSLTSSAPAGAEPAALQSAKAYQEAILPGVSRTFALTIPQLPEPLRTVVTNAYLLCRIADTIEDEPALTSEQKAQFHDRFIAVVAGSEPPEPLAEDLHPLLSAATLDDEHELVRRTPTVIAVTRALNERQRGALERCIRLMCDGMPRFQRNRSLHGLRDLAELDRYCYCVAGVVGEMLTELFCDYAPEVAEHRERMMRLAVSFGQGLQMTNILKDTWEDREHDTCWLPRDVFAHQGVDLPSLTAGTAGDGFAAGMQRLVAVAHEHLRNALTYTLHIPRREVGVRRFCMWAVMLAVLTLRNIHRRPCFTGGADVKVSRRSLRGVLVTTELAVRSDALLRRLFEWRAQELPRIAAEADPCLEAAREWAEAVQGDS